MRYLFIVVFFIACETRPGGQKPSVSSAEVLDTIPSPSARGAAVPVIFETAFITGTTQQVNKSTVHFYGINIGKLLVSSGQIIAGDPMHIDEYGKPFTQVFPTGEFPVQLSIIRIESEESIAFARINFSDSPVQKWELALQPGQAALPFGGKKMHGFSVDAGVAIFIDQVAYRHLDKDAVTQMDGGIYKAMDQHRHYGWKYAMYPFGEHNLAVFSSGLGDGYYATYIGFDKDGQPCRLLTDFNLLDWKPSLK